MDVNIKSNGGSAALIKAIAFGREEMIRALLKSIVVDVNIKDKGGCLIGARPVAEQNPTVSIVVIPVFGSKTSEMFQRVYSLGLNSVHRMHTSASKETAMYKGQGDLGSTCEYM